MSNKNNSKFTEKMLDKYYKGEISTADMADYFGVHRRTIYDMMAEHGITSKRKLWTIINLPEKLSKNLMNKYATLVDRCSKDRGGNNYYNLDYLNAKEYAEFCNQNKEKLLKMWNKYIKNNKELKYAISIDRIDTEKGYIESNIQFVPYGFNSWKDVTTPLKLTYKNKKIYCLSKNEGGRRLGFDREQTVGEAERNENGLDIDIEYLDSKEKVLKENDCKSLFEYYNKYIE